MSGGSNHLKWETRALDPAGAVCKRASIDEYHAKEFWFCSFSYVVTLAQN
jgi:hypothetical protein